MWKVIRIAFDVAGVVSLIVGIGGFKDDTKQWKEWMGAMPTMISPAIDRWIMIIGVPAIVIICAHILPRFFKKKQGEERMEKKKEASKKIGIQVTGNGTLIVKNSKIRSKDVGIQVKKGSYAHIENSIIDADKKNDD